MVTTKTHILVNVYTTGILKKYTVILDLLL